MIINCYSYTDYIVWIIQTTIAFISKTGFPVSTSSIRIDIYIKNGSERNSKVQWFK